ncbi:MAG: TrmB family transcriptional regulator [Methanobacteriota archaeon]
MAGQATVVIDKERVARIQEYGLTEYEARAYLSLLALGPSTAREAASVSRVPRTKIYSVLDDLHAKQLARIVPERPKRYEAVPFDAYIAAFETEYKKKLARIQEDRRLLASIVMNPAFNPARPGGFQVLKGRKNVVNRMFEMLGRARESIVEMGSGPAGERIRHFLPILREKHRENVRIRSLFPVTEDNAEALAELSLLAELRDRRGGGAASVLLVIDGAEAMLCHFMPDDEHLYKGEDVAIWTDDPAIVHDMRATFDANYEVGVDPAPALAEMLPPTNPVAAPL